VPTYRPTKAVTQRSELLLALAVLHLRQHGLYALPVVMYLRLPGLCWSAAHQVWVWVWGGAVPALRVLTHLQRAAPEGFAHARREGGGGGRGSPAHAGRHVPCTSHLALLCATPTDHNTASSPTSPHTQVVSASSSLVCTQQPARPGGARQGPSMALSVRVIEFLLSLPLSALIVSVGAAAQPTCAHRCIAALLCPRHTSLCIGLQHHTCT